MTPIRFARRLLRASDRALAQLEGELKQGLEQHPQPKLKVAPGERYDEVKDFVRSIDQPDQSARNYLEIHLDRIARTMSMVPAPKRTGRALELGAYMHMTPALHCVFEYEEVRGAYFGKLGRIDSKSVSVGGKEVFRCFVDHFDADRDRFPYEDNRFDLVLCCEMIEHLLLDPMHMLTEIQRVLDDGGTLILTTPNVANFTAVARMLHCGANPQVFSMYPNPRGEFRDSEFPHVREYSPWELDEAVRSAGFDIDYLFTEKIGNYTYDDWVRRFLERYGYPTEMRGEQMYCVAHKVAGAPIIRYPKFLYDA